MARRDDASASFAARCTKTDRVLGKAVADKEAGADTKVVSSSTPIRSLLPDPRSITLAAARFDIASDRTTKLCANHADALVAWLEDDVCKVDGTEFRDLDRPVPMVEVLGVLDRGDAAARRRNALQTPAPVLLS